MNRSAAKLKIQESLKAKYGSREASSMAKILLEDGFPNISDFNASETSSLFGSIQRLLADEPIQYVVGKSYFYDGYYKVNKNVLIPRPETEELCHLIISENKGKRLSILDIGTGTGCIAITCKKRLPLCELTALDISPEALNLAIENAAFHNSEIIFIQKDFLDSDNWKSLPKYDIIVSNPPYINQNEKKVMSDSTLHFEPEIALFPEGDDPNVFYKKILEFSSKNLNAEGKIYLELNEYEADNIQKLFDEKNFASCEIKKDLQGKKRILKILK